MSNANPIDVATRALRPFAKRGHAALLATSALLMVSSPAQAGPALPTGGNVASGSASIATTGNAVTVTQTSNRAIINWQGFSVGQGDAVTFNQPNAQSATLNRVTGNVGSQIAGLITSNGAVFLINPNGIVITKTGTVQTGGGFVGSTLAISDGDFNAGKLNFAGNGSSALVSNAGTISAGQGAYVALLGGTVSNGGLISVPLGKVGLGSGEQIGLDLNGGNFMQVAIPTMATGANGAALIDMAGVIAAGGGRITLSAASARNAVRNVINLSGTISADSAVGTAGSIQLLGGAGGTVTASGTLSARATGTSGNGGNVETSGAAVNFAGLKVDTTSARGGTGTWLVDPTDLTVDAAAASTISTNLATSNVTLSTDGSGNTSGPGVQSAGNGDININSALSWGSANTLTLNANHFINISAPINAPLGGLSLSAGNRTDTPLTISDTAALSVGTFNIVLGNWVQNSTTLPSFSAVNFAFSPYQSSFLRAKGGDGSVANPYLLTDIYGVQGMRGYINNLTAQNYALANDIDASGTAAWNAGAGFLPVGDNGAFTGNFDGQGHTITGLTMNSTGGAGLFAQASGNISNLVLSGGSITTTGYNTGALVGDQVGGTITNVSSSASVSGVGQIGGLVGIADGAIVNSHSSGTVTATGSNVGGLVGVLGYNKGNVSISNSSATGDVTDTSGRASGVGGLAGSATGSIDGSFATGKVTGAAGVDSVGGLVGYSCSNVNGCAGTTASITNSYATGAVASGNGNVGGLVGQGYNVSISGSYAKGTVTDTGASANIGGLVGGTRGNNVFTNVYATGDVAGTNYVGGLVGLAGSATIIQSHATGNVSATQNGGNSGFGGLVGYMDGTSSITQSYATGNVSHAVQSNAYGVGVGGLVGASLGSVTYSYATGAVSGTNDTIGGLIGVDNNQSGVADTNNYATGSVTGNLTPDAYFNGATIGGLIGAIGHDETIANSYATGNVSAVQHSGGGGGIGNDQAGGLIGYVGGKVVNISKSFATGNVSVLGAVSTLDGSGFLSNTVSNRVGGLIGYVDGGHGLIDQVYATGSVATDGQSSQIGGLVGGFYDGGNGGVFSNVYATGSVTATGAYAGPTPPHSQAVIGGLFGEIASGSVVNGYATGAVSGVANAGLIGIVPAQYDFSSGTPVFAGIDPVVKLANLYWDANTTGASVGVLYSKGDTGAGTRLTTAQMQDFTHYATTYAGFDFNTIWAPPSAGNYPQLYALTPVVYATAGNATTTYGTAPTSLGTFKGGPASYVFGPAGDTLSGFLAGSTVATVTSNAGQYAITPYAGGTVTSAGGVVYRVIGDGSGTLTINPAVITATQVNAALTGSVTKTYDGTTAALLTPANFVLTGFMNGNGASVNQTAGTFASANAGTGILVTANLSAANFVANSGTNLSNYILPTSASGTIGTITPAQLTVVYTADQLSRIYGNTNPMLTGSTSISGLVTGDSLSNVLTGTASFGTTATAASNVGSYGVVGSGLMSASGNYTLVSSQAAGNASALQITPRTVSVTANGASSTYGSAIPALTYVIGAGTADTGIVNGDTLTGALATTGSATSNVGQYAITQGTLGNPNYNLVYTGSSLVINPATLQITYTATPTTSIYGNAITNLGGTETAVGLVNGDTLASVTSGTAVFGTTATAKSNVGSYGETGSGLSLLSQNYTATFVQAAGNTNALTISQRSITVTANPQSRYILLPNPPLTYTVGGLGLANGDTLSGNLATTAQPLSPLGTYAITQGTLAASPNYKLTYVGANLTVTPPPTQSLSQFLAWLNQVIIEFEPRQQKCSSNAISAQLREGKAVSFSKTGCRK